MENTRVKENKTKTNKKNPLKTVPHLKGFHYMLLKWQFGIHTDSFSDVDEMC